MMFGLGATVAGVGIGALITGTAGPWGWILSIAGILICGGAVKLHFPQKERSEAKPNIELVEIKGAKWSPHESDEKFYFAQIWFRNSPITPGHESVARDVTAQATLTNASEGRTIVFTALWAITSASDHMEPVNTKSAIDILPNGTYAKLNLVLKYVGDRSAYAYTAENFAGDQSGKNLHYSIPPGEYAVRLLLRGIGVSKEFRFVLNNPGARHHTFTIDAVSPEL